MYIIYMIGYRRVKQFGSSAREKCHVKHRVSHHRAAHAAVITAMAAGSIWVSQALAISSSNLVVNGDAETGDIKGWTGTTASKQAVTSDGVFAGKYSFVVNRTDPATTASQFMLTDGVIGSIDSKKTYKLSFHYKVVSNSGGGSPAVWLSEFIQDKENPKELSSEVDHQIKLNPQAKAWTSFSQTIGPGGSGADQTWRAGSTCVQILMFAVDADQPGIGEMLFDNVSFAVAEPVPPAAGPKKNNKTDQAP